MPDPQTRIVNTAFYAPFGKRGVSELDASSQLVQDLICYDRVLIHSDQMNAVARVFSVMGRDAFAEAVKTGAIQFIRDRVGIGLARPASGTISLPIPVAYRAMGERSAGGVSVWPTIAATSVALQRFDLATTENTALSETVARGVIDSDKIESMHSTNASPVSEEVTAASPDTVWSGAATDLAELLDGTHEAVLGSAFTHASRADLLILEAEARRLAADPPRSTTVQLLQLDALAVVEQQPPIPTKARDLLDWYYAKRVLYLHAALGPDARVYADPMLGIVLAGKAASSVGRRATELGDVLKLLEVQLPFATPDDQFPFLELLELRGTGAAVAFRSMVLTADRGSRELAVEFVRGLRHPLSGRLRVRTLLSVAGMLSGVAGPVVDEVLRRLLEATGPTYFVDGQLRRFSERHDHRIRK